MPLYIDIHKDMKGVTAQALAEAHKKDLQTQTKYGVNFREYFFDEKGNTAFCLVEAPTREAAMRVHRESHGMVADEIHEVTENK